MSDSHTYEAHLTWTGASAGPTSSYAGYSREHSIQIPGKEPLRGSADAVFRGDGSLYSPEDLLVASLSGCHMLSYLAHAARAGVHVTSYEDSATGTMVLEGGGGHFTEVTLRPSVTISAGDPALAQTLHDTAHADCFIAASMNFPVRHDVRVTVVAHP
ncbi:MAG: OsmC family protein [Gemmatimonadota bacterium]|nr:OsmC family protein [Gemmatimonadota bacterium]